MLCTKETEKQRTGVVHMRVLCSCAHEVKGQGTPLTLAVLFPDTLAAKLCRKDSYFFLQGNGDGDKFHEQQRVTLTGQPA